MVFPRPNVTNLDKKYFFNPLQALINYNVFVYVKMCKSTNTGLASSKRSLNESRKELVSPLLLLRNFADT